MAAVPAIAVASVKPTPPIPTFPQFFETAIPEGSGAIHAYRGYIRPFSDDATSHRVLRAITAEQVLAVSAGRLDSEAIGLPEHPLEAFLKDMAEPCTIVILEFAGKKHPRAYLIDPFPIGRESGNHHTWWKRTVLIDGKATPELCIYSANQFTYDPLAERLPQFLNQVSTYVAKHLIFLRTRMLHTRQKDDTLRKMTDRKPWQPVNLGLLKLSKKLVWFGTWIGPVAPHGRAEHFQMGDPDRECHCNNGELYRDCHLESDRNSMPPSQTS